MKRYTSLTAASLLLTALSPVQTRAADNTWIGAAGAGWDLSTGGNWTPTSPWADNADAIFGALGGTPVNLSNSVAASSLTFTAPNYSISASDIGTSLNLSGAASITNNATNTSIAASIVGTTGLTYHGTGDLTLRGNTIGGQGPTAGPGNTYTGETYLRSGTLILSVTNRTSAVNGNNLLNHGTEWAVSKVGAVDAGATLKMGNYYAGGQVNYQVPRGQIQENTLVIMNGGTFDDNGSDNLQSYPAFIGTGYIVNSSAVARGVLKMSPPNNAGGQTITNACIIGDPSPMTNSPINGKIGHEIDIDLGNSGNTTWIFTGANPNLGGSWRLSGSQVLKFDGAGSMGTPVKPYTTPNTFRMNGGNPAATLDLNGTSQTTGGFTGSGNSTGNSGQPNAVVCNNKPGTLSIITVGAVDLGLNPLPPITIFFPQYGSNITYTPGSGSTFAGAFLDNTGTGGTLGVTKVGTNIAQFTGTWNISGPLVVSNGFLNLVPGAGSGATPVLNGPVYLYSNGNLPGSVTNSYLGLFTIDQNAVIPVPALYIDGVPQTNGLYGAFGNTGGAREVSVISNGATPTADVLEVHDFQPPLTYTHTGNSLVITWPYATYKLQAQTNSLAIGLTSTWHDYPGGDSAPVTVPISKGNASVFLKLSPK